MTHKPFIGKVDKQNRQFNLTCIHSPLQKFLPQLWVKRQFISKTNKTEIKLNYRLGFLTSVFCLFILYVAGQVVWKILQESTQAADIWDGVVIWLLLFLIGGTILVFLEINRVANKVFDVLFMDELNK